MNKLSNQHLDLLSDCLFYHRIKNTYIERHDGKTFAPRKLFNMAMDFPTYKDVWEWMNDESTQEINMFVVKGEVNAMADLDRIITINIELKQHNPYNRTDIIKQLLGDVLIFAKKEDLVVDYIKWLCECEMTPQLNTYLEDSLYYERISR